MWLPLRLAPGEDVRAALIATVAARHLQAAFVVAGIGSLAGARLRYAGDTVAVALDGHFELLTLSGSLAASHAHLHACIADSAGRVYGGHLLPGCTVRTTLEALLLPLPQHTFLRVPDPATGFDELEVRPRLPEQDA